MFVETLATWRFLSTRGQEEARTAFTHLERVGRRHEVAQEALFGRRRQLGGVHGALGERQRRRPQRSSRGLRLFIRPR